MIESRGIYNDGREAIFYKETLCLESCNLVSLEIGEGVLDVYCQDNDIETLVLPDSLLYLSCDLKVKGLEKYIVNESDFDSSFRGDVYIELG